MPRNLSNNLVEMKLLINDAVYPHGNIRNYYVECTADQKYDIIKGISAEANENVDNNKVIIFFTVWIEIIPLYLMYL